MKTDVLHDHMKYSEIMQQANDSLVNVSLPTHRLRQDTKLAIAISDQRSVTAWDAISEEQARTVRAPNSYRITVRPATNPGRIAKKNPIHLS